MGGQMDTRELFLLMVQIVPNNLKEQSFLLNSVVHGPWTRFLVGLLLHCQFHGGHRPDLYTQLLLKTSRHSDPGAFTHGNQKLRQMVQIGGVEYFFASEAVTQLLMMGIKDCWVLWVHEPLPAQVRSKEVVGMGVEVSTPIPLLQDTHKRASLFWKHAGKKEKSFFLDQKESSQLLSRHLKTHLLRTYGPTPPGALISDTI